MVLTNKKNSLKHLYDEGCIDENDYADIRKEIDSRIMQVRGSNVSLEDIRFNEVFAHCPLFSMLNQTELSELRSKSKIKEYKKGTVLIRANMKVKAAMIVVSGSVK